MLEFDPVTKLLGAQHIEDELLFCVSFQKLILIHHFRCFSILIARVKVHVFVLYFEQKLAILNLIAHPCSFTIHRLDYTKKEMTKLKIMSVMTKIECFCTIMGVDVGEAAVKKCCR